MWPFSKKQKSGKVATDRMKKFVRSGNQNPQTTRVHIKNASEDEINSVVNYIKDFAYRNFSVEKQNVKVHVSKEDNGFTIVASIVYK
ncbi:hypothetical protein OF820_11665 [Oceanotoga sp. DSM 15011]|uniref:Uncharacterized protein n=1 Tax=Oceanotoga teriensis TaxID=515440 RepID=A0AA45HIA7_9BACT|nr:MULTISPECIES: hypothetical protein [Oceanotoga]MDN5343103.1 hypothetical protein [Oceanotoga sp.]PWJ91223.1 hypothetical protein C7380_11129 [Oceanotoga teriensis]UYO99698.1 hypothetical protein OF820_11665 [Oceanotoga sp. DSM 15011]